MIGVGELRTPQRRLLPVSMQSLAAATALASSVGVGALLASPLPPALSIAVAAALVSAVLGMGIWLLRPDFFIGSFLFALPLLEDREVVFGLNPGEIATLFVIAVAFLSIATTTSRIPPEMRAIIGTLLALAAVGAISSLANGTVAPSELASAILKPLSWAVVVYLVFAHFDSERKVYGLLLAATLAAGVVGLVGILEQVTGRAHAALSGGPARADATFEHWNTLGGYLVLLLLPTLAYALASRRRELKLVLFAAFLAQLAALLLSATLGSIVALLLALAVAFPLWRARPRLALALAALPAIALVSLSLLTPVLAERAELFEDRTRARLATYAAGIELGKDRFWFGTGTLERATEEIVQNPEYRFTRFGETSSQPHNAFISVFVERGILGLLLLAWLAWLALKILLRSRPPPDARGYVVHSGLLLGGIAFLIQNFTNSLLIHARLGLVFLALVAIAARLHQLRESAAGAAASESKDVASTGGNRAR